MKATGVVRRIDDLGRVVIPKEIRRTLRIKEGDPLEIFTDKEGEVILKKYSPIGELSEFATEYAETLNKTTGHIACITDKDTVIAISGASKKEWLEKEVSNELERIMEDKEQYISKENNDLSVPITQNENKDRIYNSQVIYPIISDGNTIGSVILLSKDSNGNIKKEIPCQNKSGRGKGLLGNALFEFCSFQHECEALIVEVEHRQPLHLGLEFLATPQKIVVARKINDKPRRGFQIYLRAGFVQNVRDSNSKSCQDVMFVLKM